MRARARARKKNNYSICVTIRCHCNPPEFRWERTIPLALESVTSGIFHSYWNPLTLEFSAPGGFRCERIFRAPLQFRWQRNFPFPRGRVAHWPILPSAECHFDSRGACAGLQRASVISRVSAQRRPSGPRAEAILELRCARAAHEAAHSDSAESGNVRQHEKRSPYQKNRPIRSSVATS